MKLASRPKIAIILSLLLVISLSACSTKEVTEIAPIKQEQNTQENLLETHIRICFLYEDENSKFYFDEGQIFAENRLLGDTKNGCVYFANDNCNGPEQITFYPNSLKEYNFNITSFEKLDTCKDNHIIISKKQFEHFSKLKWSLPYVTNVKINDETFKTESEEITKSCKDNSCKINSVYRHVITELKYIKDPESSQDIIFDPDETINRGGGDCEDLTGVLNSYLENIGIKTYIVLTDDHAYSLACGIDMEKIKSEIINSLYQETEITKKEDISLEAGEVHYIGETQASQGNNAKFSYSIKSDNKVDIYVVESQNQYLRFINDDGFSHYPECEGKEVTEISKKCDIADTGGIILFNKQNKNTNIKLNLNFKYSYYLIDPKEIKVHYYNINNQNCVVLEPTAGKFGYPGFSIDNSKIKLAIDPKEKKIIMLD